MDFSIATVKVTITLDQAQLREIRKMVKKNKSRSVSGFVQHAVKNALSEASEYRKMLDEALEKTGGPLTDEERAWADSILLAPGRRARKKRKAA